ncbi:hypothetical protein ACNPPY_15310 [Achromobacter sp. AGC78]|uniref:Uncharacterized protein n=1 Tax=Achromobacter spanius TaxID=217203 RepID=A0AA42S6S0_9BURK|nr:hypothetical protein [Achromobacter spanius]MDH0739957.1 hypothetical protein [Achromobacter spanius]
MPQSPTHDLRKSIPGQPDVNAGALRPASKPQPSSKAQDGRALPDVDHPPPAHSHGTGFDRAVAQEEAEARDGTLPGSNDTRPAPSTKESKP